MKSDYLNARILSHRANLQRYATLLATQLTELERGWLHKRIAEERAQVASLELSAQQQPRRAPPPSPSAEGSPASPLLVATATQTSNRASPRSSQQHTSPSIRQDRTLRWHGLDHDREAI